MNTELLTVSQVLAIPPGTKDIPSWISPGFSGVCQNITMREYGAQKKKMWPTVIADPTTGNIVEVTFFSPPAFSEGDEVRFSGAGIQRTAFNTTQKVQIGSKAVVDVRPGTQRVAAAVHGAQAQHAAECMIEGQAVGNGMTNVWELARYVYTPAGLKEAITSSGFWMWFHEVLSDHLRIANMVKSGKLADPVKVRHGPKPASPAQAPAPQPEVRPAVTPKPSTIEQELGAEEDVPY